MSFRPTTELNSISSKGHYAIRPIVNRDNLIMKSKSLASGKVTQKKYPEFSLNSYNSRDRSQPRPD